MTRTSLVRIAVFLLAGLPAFAQVDFTGHWAPRYHEDQPERIPGPELGDYLGLPINDAARLRADSWDASIQTLPEHQCIPHPGTYSFRGPANLRVSSEVDPVTQDVISYTIYGTFGRATRVIWMDGRPHPSANAAHTWAGFSTGQWEGRMLTVETTHLKAGYIRRNGVIHSDLATMREHFIREGDYLTIVTIVQDPVYLTEPFIRTTDFVLDNTQSEGSTPCDVTVEVVRPPDKVPHHLPGTNTFLNEFPETYHLPPTAARGGAATMYPEYRQKLTGAPGVVAAPVFALEHVSAPADPGIEVLPVRGNIYMVAAGGRNIALSVGPDGVLMVDTALAAQADAIAAAIRKLTSKPIRYIINTSADGEHTGGNTALAAMGQRIGGAGAGASGFSDVVREDQRAEIFAHENVLNRMSAPTGQASPRPTSAWPTTTFITDTKELFFNDEAVQIIHEKAAHSDGDSIVFFRRSDVISTGDLFVTAGYPMIDLQRGGSIQGFLDALSRILEITIPATQQEGGTLVIPGHGRLCDEADVVEFRDMVTIIRDRIQDGIHRGLTLEQVKAVRPTRDYDGRYGSTTGAWTTDMFVEAVYRSLSPAK
jgi:glyoxylase-like metal-dependent hydrolase (beta-lactamase superfamily II)